MSLRRRVLVGFLVVAAALVVTNVVLASTFEDDLLRRTDGDLVETATRPELARERRRGPGQLEPLTDIYLAVANLDGSALTRLGRPLDADQHPPEPTPEQLVEHATSSAAMQPFTVGSSGDSTWRVVVRTARVWVGDHIEPGLLVVATPLDEMETTLARMWRIQVLGSIAVLAALAAVSWWVVRQGVRPLMAMASTADEIAAGDLSRRVDDTSERTEAGRLGIAFNSMLGEIEQAFREREASEARLRRFAADASHELRTPLTSIRGYAELWQSGGLREPGELDQAMRRLAEEGRRMGSLVEDLLLLARLDEQRPPDVAPVRLDLLAVDGVQDALAVEPDRPIRCTTEPVTVAGDEQRLRQVVANLVTNARVHTPAGAPIHVRVTSTGGSVRLEVADEGPGMTSEVVANVFERFYRADDSRGRSTGGAGLGLSIVDAIVRNHGGRVSADSTVGAGSRFVVELPAPVTGATSPTR